MNTSQDFFATLATMYQSEESGAIFGITDNDRLLVVAFDAGEIKGLRFGRLTGGAVLAELQNLEIKSFSIKLDKSIPLQLGLPTTFEILTKLASRIPSDVLTEVLSDSAKRIPGAKKKPKMMYRGQVVTPEAAPVQPQPPTQRKMMYRGQVVTVEVPPAPQAQTNQSRMMYRGQPVGDQPAPPPNEPSPQSTYLDNGQAPA